MAGALWGHITAAQAAVVASGASAAAAVAAVRAVLAETLPLAWVGMLVLSEPADAVTVSSGYTKVLTAAALISDIAVMTEKQVNRAATRSTA